MTDSNEEIARLESVPCMRNDLMATPPQKEAVDDPPTCVSCRKGHLVLRRGPHGRFYGCSTFPACRATYSESEAAEMYDPSGLNDYGEEPH